MRPRRPTDRWGQGLERVEGLVTGLVGPVFEILTHLGFLPGVYIRMAIRGAIFHSAVVPIVFGSAVVDESRGTFDAAGQRSTPAARALLWSFGLQSLLGLLLLFPSALRHTLLGIPFLTPSYDESSIIDHVVNRWILDWPQGLALWLGSSCLVLAPPSSSEWVTIQGALRGGRRSAAVALAGACRRLTRLVEPLDALGRASLGALWASLLIWALVRAIEATTALLA